MLWVVKRLFTLGPPLPHPPHTHKKLTAQSSKADVPNLLFQWKEYIYLFLI